MVVLMTKKKGAETTFGAKLKALRESRKPPVTQEAVARAVDVSTSFISKLEQTEMSPTWNTVAKICRFFDVSPDYFMS